MKQVRENSNASAYVVLNRKGQDVAHVQFRFADAVQCDVWARKPGETFLSLVHQKKASGYGYDKSTAALAGAVIEGFRMADHCGRAEDSHELAKTRFMSRYRRAAIAGLTNEQGNAWREKARKLGCSLCNWYRQEWMPSGPDGKEYAWGSLHTLSGLERLTAAGFRVVQVL